MWQKMFFQLLHDYFDQVRTRNSKFSQRALARKLKVSHATVSDLLAGRRMVSSRKTLKMMAEMKGFEEERVAAIAELIKHDRDDRVLLSEENYDIVTDWLYIAILCALELDDPPNTEEDLARFFGVSRSRVRKCLKRLTQLKLIAQPGRGFLLTGKYFTTSDDVPQSSLVKAHKKDMLKAHEVLDGLAPKDRDFVSLTVVGDAKKMKDAKVMIRKFLDRLSFALRGPDSNEVFKASVQLYSLKGKK